MTLSASLHSRKDSYPPTQIRISRPGYYQEVENMEDDPLAYFLTPAEYLDAGIEDKRRPRASVRHVTPNTLDELRYISRRRISPSRSSDTSSGSDDEDYVRFRPGGAGYERHFETRYLRTPEPTRHRRSNSAPSAPTIDLTIQTRGRSQKRSSHGSSVSRSISRGPAPRVWREPSPDVWSIAEHPEEYQDGASDVGSLASERYLYERRKRSNSARSYLQTTAEREEISAFPVTKKKVRFAPLPRREDY